MASLRTGTDSTWASQVTEEDLGRVAAATGAQVQTTVNNLNPKVLGTCAQFEEQQVRALSGNKTAYLWMECQGSVAQPGFVLDIPRWNHHDIHAF